MPEKLIYEIKNSVGRRSKGAVNEKNDVETVQNMLRLAAMIESEARLDPGGIDGLIGTNEANSNTVKAIEAFQSRFASKPDGVIGVGQRTWRELLAVLEGDETDDETNTETASDVTSTDPVPAGEQFFFPFTELPKLDWTAGSMRAFGSSRSGGSRWHDDPCHHLREGNAWALSFLSRHLRVGN
jgi:hypothetical protein